MKKAQKNNQIDNSRFTLGVKFLDAGQTWLVTKEFQDSGCDFRRVTGSDGTDRIMELWMLQYDSDQPGFMFLEATPSEIAMAKARKD
jgi:hypothetical protein